MRVLVGPGAFRSSILEMFERNGWTPTQTNPDLLCLSGGSDISPSLYNQKPLKGTYFSDSADREDLYLYEKFRSLPKVGICRGGQLLNVLSGGSMWQDVDGHEVSHKIKLLEDDSYVHVSSIHHQMMIPSPDALLIGVANEASYRLKDGGNEGDNQPDIEILYYNETKSLCYQPHPEIGPEENESLFFSLIDRYL